MTLSAQPPTDPTNPARLNSSSREQSELKDFGSAADQRQAAQIIIEDRRQLVVQSDVSQSTLVKLDKLFDQNNKKLATLFNHGKRG